jgi:hypothetical protein
MVEPRHFGVSMRGTNMSKYPLHIAAMALTFALLAAPVAAYAQSEVPVREGNVWGWHDHQPTETEVSRKEKEAGIAPTPALRDSNSAAVDELYQKLMHRPPG